MRGSHGRLVLSGNLRPGIRSALLGHHAFTVAKAAYLFLLGWMLFFIPPPSPAYAITLSDMYKTSGVKYGELITKAGTTIQLTRPAIAVNPIAGLVVGVAAAYIIEKGQEALHDLQIQAGASNGDGFPTPSGWDTASDPGLRTAQAETRWCGLYGGKYYPGATVGVAQCYGYDTAGAASATVYEMAYAAREGVQGGCPVGWVEKRTQRVADTGPVSGVYSVNASYWCQSPTVGVYFGNAIYNTSQAVGSYVAVSRTGCMYLGDGWQYNSNKAKCEAVAAPANQWPSDATPTLRHTTGGSWQTNPYDPDSSGLDAPAGNTITFNGTTDDGDLIQNQVTAKTDGSLDYKVTTQYDNGAGSSDVRVDQFTVGPSGTVTSYNHNVYENTTINNITNNTGGNVVYQEPNPTVDIGSGTIDIDLPDDYNRESTQQEIKDALTEQATAPENPDLPVVTPVLPEPVELGGGYTCPADITFNAMGRSMTYSWEPICNFAETVNPVVVLAGIALGAFILVGGLRT